MNNCVHINFRTILQPPVSICIRKIVHPGPSYSLMIALYLEGPTLRKFYVQMVFYSEGAMFERCYVQKVLYSEDLCSEGVMLEHISIFQFQVKNIFFIPVHFTFLFYFLHNFIIHFFLGYTRMSSEDPTSFL